jgi:SpoVK/Ycf46/Vps4 family AAA+-type ATPase
VTDEPDAADREVVDGKVRAAAWSEDAELEADVERPKVTFKDVGGMDALKDEIRMKIIHPLTHADLYKAYGKQIGGGILMYGPPGCGKTHLARATAGEIKAGFIAVGINDVLDMWIGNSEKNLHQLFEQARRNRPCVLFFDEVDALAASRSDMRHSASRHLINQFLAEMDGLQSNNDGVLILAATNAPWHVDPAFRRPGRFDRILFVPPPDAPARAGILRILFHGKPVQDVDYDQVAKKTDQFSGADLKAVLDLTVEAKLREAMKDGIPKPMTTKDVLGQIGKVKPSTKEWFATARNYALYSNQGGVYDDILKYLKM